MSAPATKPGSFADRTTSPPGRSPSMTPSTASSSAITSSDSELVLASFRSNKSHAIPSPSLESRQCNHGDEAVEAGPSSSSAITSSDSELVLASFRSNKSHAIPSPSLESRQCNHGDEAVEAGPSSSSFPARTSRTLLFMVSSYSPDQHRAALAAANTFGRYPKFLAEAPHRVDEMQHDAVAAGADGMAEADGAAIDVETRAIDSTSGAVEAQHLAAEGVILPGSETSEHLGRESFVDFPEINIAEFQMAPLQESG